MKKNLLLFLSQFKPENIAFATTLAWISKENNYLFDNYYDSYHSGIHFGGGDARGFQTEQLTGGTVLADRHFEELYFLLLNFNVRVVALSKTILYSSIKNLGVPILSVSNDIMEIYKNIFAFFNTSLPSDLVMIGSGSSKRLYGFEAYLFPEIAYRRAIGIPETATDEQINQLYRDGSKILCVCVQEKTVKQLEEKGYEVEVIDKIKNSDNYLTISERTVRRWKNKAGGWILGDPTVIIHWLPTAYENNLLPIYSTPQEKIISRLKDLISSKGRIVYGRQYSDRDFFELSKLNKCLQVIDPCRPPFQSVQHVIYNWQNKDNNFYGPEYSDEELRKFAEEGRILISLLFWTGMIREIANLYNLIDVIIINKMKCGLVLTAQSYEYMMHSPLELLNVPLQNGGAYPLIEPLLGSCGIGVGIESLLSEEYLKKSLEIARGKILVKIENTGYLPKGWWPTLDTELELMSWWRRPKPFRFFTQLPYFQLRYHKNENIYAEDPAMNNDGLFPGGLKKNIKDWMRKKGLENFFYPYRPYEFYKAGAIKEHIVTSVKSAGFEYMFTKSQFNPTPKILYIDGDFIALNYTAGRWDGWTPFETINDVDDLKRSEKALIKGNKPGWIVSTIDCCLWTFGGEFWQKATKLHEIIRFCVEGGKSNRLINVKPYTISRYARIIAEKGIPL